LFYTEFFAAISFKNPLKKPKLLLKKLTIISFHSTNASGIYTHLSKYGVNLLVFPSVFKGWEKVQSAGFEQKKPPGWDNVFNVNGEALG
jgi:hypothetical protein